MSQETDDRRWPSALQSCWIDGASVLGADATEEEKPGRDSLGNPGRVRVMRRTGRLSAALPRGNVVQRLTQRGLVAVRDTAEETELTDRRAAVASASTDPFLLEKHLEVTVRGRELPPRQRDAVEARVAALRRESADAGIPATRRAAVEAMIRDLGEGLVSTLDVRMVERRFQPSVAVKDPVESMGRVVPLSVGARIVYSVAPVRPEAGDDGEAEPMVFHVVGLGAREAVLLYTGGVHGQRHLRDLESSEVHHAWFANRERVKTEATAPWVSRRVHRALAAEGRASLVVEKRRDAHPVTVERVGTETFALRIDDREVVVPVLRCSSAADDLLLVLDDPENPLVLRLEERGSELVRTVDAIHTLPLHAAIAI